MADISKLVVDDSEFDIKDATAREAIDSINATMETKADLVDGIIPSSQLPSYVDDVIEGTLVNTTTFKGTDGKAITPESGKAYVDVSTNKTYRWSGTQYAVIGTDLALGETASTAYPGDKGKAVTDTVNSHTANTTSHITSAERTAWNNKASTATATTGANGLMSAADKTKLDGIATNANKYSHPSYTARTGVPTANQTPGFGGSFDVSQPVSDASGHITAVNSRTVTIPSTAASQSVAGLMSASDKKKLDGIATNANKYSHPSYTARTGVPTANQTPGFGGSFSVTQPVSDATGHITGMTSRTITIPSTAASTSAAGLMSASDKKKLDGVATSVGSTAIPVYFNNGVPTRCTELGSQSLPFGDVNTTGVCLRYERGTTYGYTAKIYHSSTSQLMYQSTSDKIYDVAGLVIDNDCSGGIRLAAHGGRIFFEGSTVSANTSITTASDPKIKIFTEDVENDEDKLLRLYDRLIIKSYKLKDTDSNRIIIGLNAEDVEITCKELGIDPEKYNFIRIDYNYKDGSREDAKYYTKFRSLSYSDLFALGILKNKKMTERINILESRLVKLEERMSK